MPTPSQPATTPTQTPRQILAGALIRLDYWMRNSGYLSDHPWCLHIAEALASARLAQEQMRAIASPAITDMPVEADTRDAIRRWLSECNDLPTLAERLFLNTESGCPVRAAAERVLLAALGQPTDPPVLSSKGSRQSKRPGKPMARTIQKR